MMSEYDLHKFTVVDHDRIDKAFDFKCDNTVRSIAYLVDVGILQRGPEINTDRTVRIRPCFLLSPKELARQYEEQQAMLERCTLASPLAL